MAEIQCFLKRVARSALKLRKEPLLFHTEKKQIGLGIKSGLLPDVSLKRSFGQVQLGEEPKAGHNKRRADVHLVVILYLMSLKR